MGPYEVDVVFDNGIVRLVTIDDTRTTFIVNGHRLRPYCKPASKDDFIKQLSEKSHLKFISAENPSRAP